MILQYVYKNNSWGSSHLISWLCWGFLYKAMARICQGGLHFPECTMLIPIIPKEDFCGSERRHAAEERGWDDSININASHSLTPTVFPVCSQCCFLSVIGAVLFGSPDLWPCPVGAHNYQQHLTCPLLIIMYWVVITNLYYCHYSCSE